MLGSPGAQNAIFLFTCGAIQTRAKFVIFFCSTFSHELRNSRVLWGSFSYFELFFCTFSYFQIFDLRKWFFLRPGAHFLIFICFFYFITCWDLPSARVDLLMRQGLPSARTDTSIYIYILYVHICIYIYIVCFAFAWASLLRMSCGFKEFEKIRNTKEKAYMKKYGHGHGHGYKYVRT